MYFSDIFKVEQSVLDAYGAFNVSLINDLPLFVDPFLLFNSKKAEYQQLHDEIIKYVVFLRDESLSQQIDTGLIKRWFHFSEVKQNWLGFSVTGNSGTGLGKDFATGLHRNFSTVLKDFGEEKITKKSHLEKLCLFKDGIGRDNISDFTTNLIKKYLLDYTQAFALKYLSPEQKRNFMVDKVYFNYQTRSWVNELYTLPTFNDDFVLLTPTDILTKDDTWINRNGLFRSFTHVANSIENSELRSQLNDYFRNQLPRKPSADDRAKAKAKTFEQFPDFIDYFIRYQETHGTKASVTSKKKVDATFERFVAGLKIFSDILEEKTQFYATPTTSYQSALQRVNFLKQVIEKNEGYRLFYNKNEVVGNEKDLQIIFRLAWFNSPFSVDSEVNNGRGPVDYKISKGFSDATLVEFKLASNSKLEQNLKKQLEIYLDANQSKNGIKVILFFTALQEQKVKAVLKRLGILGKENVVLIDGRRDNKKSASTV